MSEVELLFDYHGELTECPTWDVELQSLFWADILAKQIHQFRPKDGFHRVWDFPEEVGCFALRKDQGFIVALRHAIWLTNGDGDLQQKICDNPSNPHLARFNDGGTDALGRFYAGTMWEPGDFNGALLCRVDTERRVKVLHCDIEGHNGLAFSPDNQWMVTSDTPNGLLYRSALSADGEPGARTCWHRFDPDKGVPDGGAFDAEGYYWSALFNGFEVVRIAPDGQIVQRIKLPVRCPTMVCFGGQELKTLYITSSRENMTPDELQARPLSGAIFQLTVEVAGVEKPRFNDNGGKR